MTAKTKAIKLAPRDGTPVVTDCGIACYVDQRNWGSPVPHGKWVLCDTSGDLLRDEEGHHICEPKTWTVRA